MGILIHIEVEIAPSVPSNLAHPIRFGGLHREVDGVRASVVR